MEIASWRGDFFSFSFQPDNNSESFLSYFNSVIVCMLAGNCVCVCVAKEQIESLDNSNGVCTQ